jgi:hypothetical protein
MSTKAPILPAVLKKHRIARKPAPVLVPHIYFLFSSMEGAAVRGGAARPPGYRTPARTWRKGLKERRKTALQGLRGHPVPRYRIGGDRGSCGLLSLAWGAAAPIPPAQLNEP